MRKARRIRQISGAALALVLIMTGCSASPPKATEEESGDDLVINGEFIADGDLLEAARAEAGPLLLYITTPEEKLKPIRDAFTADTGIKTEHVRLPSARMYERIMSEFGGKVLNADIVDQSDRLSAQNLIDAGVFVPHKLPESFEIPDGFSAEGDYWHSPSVPMMVLGYNTALVDAADVPKRWEDLVDKRFKDRIGTTAAGVGASTWTLMYFLRQLYGVEYWEDFAALNPVIQSSGVPLADELIRGEIHIAPSILSLLVAAKEAGEPVDWVFPEEGITTFANLQGVSSTAKNPNSAHLWMNYVMSVRGSELVADASGDLTPHPVKIDLGYEVPTFKMANMQLFDEEKYTTMREPWSKEWNGIFKYVG